MKLRMYLRGLGLGMIVAALVLTFGVKTENRTMTDAEVRARAKELGMVDEATTLKNANVPEGKTEDVAPEEEEKKEEVVKEEAAKETVKEKVAEETQKDEVKQPAEEKKAGEDIKAAEDNKKAEEDKESAEGEKKAAEEKKAEEEKKAADKKKEEEQKKTDEKKAENEKVSKPYTLTIQSGYSSDRVANVLADAGVISSASAFDTYLCSNGYDHRISTGTYAIPAGADFQTIAKMITNSN